MPELEPDDIGCAPFVIFPLAVLLCIIAGCGLFSAPKPVQQVTQQPTVAPEVTAKLDTIIKAQGDVQSTVTSALTTVATAITTSVQKQDALEAKVSQTVGQVGSMVTDVSKISYDMSANQLKLASKRDWRYAVLGLIAFLVGVILPDPPKLYRFAMLGIMGVAALALILL